MHDKDGGAQAQYICKERRVEVESALSLSGHVESE